MKIKKYSHIIYPVLSGLLFILLSIWKKEVIVRIITEISIQEILFSYSSTILGFALATYGIFMTLFPSLDKNVQKSTTLKSINNYFFYFLLLMVIQVISSVIFLFDSNYNIFMINAAIFGIAIVMVTFIIRGIRGIYNLIINQN